MIMSETLVVSSRDGIADFGLTKGVEDEIKSHIDIPLVRVVRKEMYMYTVEPQLYHRRFNDIPNLMINILYV